MDAYHTTQFMLSDRPLLGVMVFATCLAGGTAVQNSAGATVPVSAPQFAPGWTASAPTNPVAALRAVQAPLPPLPASKAANRVRNSAALAVSARALPATGRKLHHFAPQAAPTPHIAQSPVVTPLVEVIQPEPAAAPVAPLATPSAPAPLANANALPLSAAPVATAATVAASVPQIADERPLELVSTPELRKFDLARFSPSATAKRTAKLAASHAGPAKGAMAHKVDRLIDGVVFHQTAISFNGQSGGSLAVRVGPDMKPSIKVADLLGLVSDRLDPDAQARFSAASAAGEYVSFSALRTAGFDVSYSAGSDSIAISVSQ